MAVAGGGASTVNAEMIAMAKKEVDIAKVDDYNRDAPKHGNRHAIIQAACKGDLAALERMLKESPDAVGGPPDGVPGVTPLHMAAHSNQEGACTVLLEHGADVNADDGAGWTLVARGGA